MAGICEYGEEPSGSIKCGEFLAEPVSFSRRTLLHGVSELFLFLSTAVWQCTHGVAVRFHILLTSVPDNNELSALVK